MPKLLGLWLRSNLIPLNPCEMVRSQRKKMFTRVKMGAEEEIHRAVYASVERTGKGNKRKNSYAARKSRKQLVKFQINNTVVFSRRCLLF